MDEPRLSGQMLDSRPSNPSRALQMETQYVPAAQAVDASGVTWARVAPVAFPRGADGNSTVVHRVTSYKKKPLWDAVDAWFAGGPPADGRINPADAHVHVFPGGGGATWRIHSNGTPKEKKTPVAWSSFATPTAHGPDTFGYKWDFGHVRKTDSPDGPLVTLPEYDRLETRAANKSEWVPVRAEDVPAETGLARVRFAPARGGRAEPYVTPEEPAICWKKPGPKAGPFRARLGDGSVVTYYWYRSADQPAMLNADLTEREREDVQARVEKLHRAWKKDRDYLPPPATGALAEVDPALIVTPPPGLEVGYVPVPTRQAANE